MSKYTQVPAKDCLPCCFYEGCAVDGVMFFGADQVTEIVRKCRRGFVWKQNEESL